MCLFLHLQDAPGYAQERAVQQHPLATARARGAPGAAPAQATRAMLLTHRFGGKVGAILDRGTVAFCTTIVLTISSRTL